MMDWKKIAPWNWFKEEEEEVRATRMPARFRFSADPFANLQDETEQSFVDIFDRSFNGTLSMPAVARRFPASIRPRVDISEGKKAYSVRAEFPGVEHSDIAIEVEGHILVISAEKRQESEVEDEGYHCVESTYGVIRRVLCLPDDAESAGVEANFKNGILKLRIPKCATAVSNARKIEVSVG